MLKNIHLYNQPNIISPLVNHVIRRLNVVEENKNDTGCL